MATLVHCNSYAVSGEWRNHNGKITCRV